VHASWFDRFAAVGRLTDMTNATTKALKMEFNKNSTKTLLSNKISRTQNV